MENRPFSTIKPVPKFNPFTGHEKELRACIEKQKKEMMILSESLSTLLKRKRAFSRKDLESWLYQIAYNNTDNDLSKYCEEIIGRLDGFERFVENRVKEEAKEKINGNSNQDT